MPDPELPVFDRAVLADLDASMGGDRGFVVELVEAYLADAPEQLAAIAAAAEAGDAAALVRPAHTLKSSSATVGALGLAEMSRRLEFAGRSGSITDEATRADVAGIGEAWAAAEAALRAWIAEGAG